MPEADVFNGFFRDTFKFLSDLEKNNNTKWFNKNRGRYDESIVHPSRAFVQSIGQFFNHLNPSIRTEPKFNKTLMRISNDMRFTKGAPYKNYFLIHFGRFKMDSEFYVYLDKKGIAYGVFLNNSSGEELYFNKNVPSSLKELKTLFRKYKLNRAYNFYTFNKDPELIKAGFNADDDLKLLEKTKYILFEKTIPKKEKIIYSSSFINTAIKAFSHLYPLYCYAISPEPFKLIERFEENMGIPG